MTIKITWLGCASYILDLNGTRLLFDPFFYRQINKKANPKLKTKQEDIKNVAAIFITHGHFDHCTDAGWFAENLDIPVYCSETAKNNMIRWAEGKIMEDHTHALSERGKNNIKPIDYFEKIKISNDITVESVKLKHIRFDAETIWSRLKSKEFRKSIKSLKPLGLGFRKGKVFGFYIYYKDIKVFTFGSLYEKDKETLKKYQNIDILIAPLAGNSAKHLAIKGGKIIDLLKPKIVIPHHWDDFWPPVSRIEDLKPFFKYMGENLPDIIIKMLEIDKEITIDIYK